MAQLLGTLSGKALLLGGALRLVVPKGALSALSVVDYAVAVGDTCKTAMHVIQRAPGLTTRDIPVVFAFSGGAPVSIQGRVRKRVGGLVKDWTFLTALTLGAASGGGLLPGVPQGADYILDIRDGVTQPASGPLFASTVGLWGVGVRVLAQGQSNMVSTLSGGYLGTTVPGTSLDENGYFNSGAVPGCISDTYGAHAPTNANSYWGPGGPVNTATNNCWLFLRLVAASLKVKYGYAVPVALIPYAVGATPIAAFIPGGTYYTQFIQGASAVPGSVGLASGAPYDCGDFEGVLWHQGEADAGSTQAAYQAALGVLWQGYLTAVAKYGRTASTLFFLPAVLGNYTLGNCPSIENIRAAEMAFCTATGGKVRAGWSCVDLPPGGDGLHMSLAAVQMRSMHRAIQSVLFMLGAAPFSGRGPVISTVARSGLVATVSVTHEGGTALAGATGSSAITGWQANTAADFSGTAIVVTAAISGAAAVAVTFPGGTVFPAYLKYQGGLIGSASSAAPDTSNALYDNVSYPSGATGTDLEALGLPVLPTLGALVVT